MDSTFAERLLYWQFRSAAHLARALGPVSWKRLQNLLRMAIYDELSAQGLKHAHIAAALGVAPALIAGWAQKARKPATWPEAAPMVQLIIDALIQADGPVDEFDLEDMVYYGDLSDLPDPEPPKGSGFYQKFEITLNALKTWGLIRFERTAQTRLIVLSQRYDQQKSKNLAQPYIEGAELLDDLVSVTNLLVKTGPMSHGRLMAPEIRHALPMDEARMERILEWCQASASRRVDVSIQVDTRGPEPIYSAHPEARPTDMDEITQHQIAAIQLIKQTRSFLSWLATEPDPRLIAMKMFTFRSRPEDLPRFLRDHMTMVVEAVRGLEESAADDETSIPYSFTWVGYSDEAPPER